MTDKINRIFLVAVGVACSINLFSQSEYLFSPKGIAEIHITLEDGKQIGDIKNEKANDDYAGKVNATMYIRNSASSSYDEHDFYAGKIQIDGRGNTSWHHSKRPYNIDLVGDDWESERPAALLGMGQSDEWALLAFWMDRSLMRFQLASYLGRRMSGIPWMPDNRYVEVWINDDYRGLYALTQKVQRGDYQIKIKKLDAASTDLSGGYILEASPEDGHKSTPIEVATQIKTARDGINFVFKYPKPKNVTQPQRTWIKNHLDEFEDVLRSENYKDPVNGYLKYINEASFIDWTILHELSKGCDNLFHASVFVHKDREGKLNMSAPWDFDLSFGNSGIYTENGNWVKTHRWFGRLYQDERYAQKFNDRYDELFPLFQQIPAILRANYQQLEAAGALDREYGRFPQILEEHINEDGGRRTPVSYLGHMQFLSEWTMSRNNWVYINLGTTDAEKGERMKTIKPVIRIMDPENMYDGKSFDVKVMKSDDNNRYSYSWNNAAFGSSESRRISSSQKGKYWVHVKDEWGNTSLASDTLYVGVNPPTGIAAKPNSSRPTVHYSRNSNTLTVYYPAKAAGLTVQLFDLNGGLVRENVSVARTEKGAVQISTTGLKHGMYVLQLRSEAENVILKFYLPN
ncbi:MAG: CotH kinase family protein [Bacteroidales bacterium]|nr:CotH kinase family protein [Bacteroidales bacterium]